MRGSISGVFQQPLMDIVPSNPGRWGRLETTRSGITRGCIAPGSDAAVAIEGWKEEVNYWVRMAQSAASAAWASVGLSRHPRLPPTSPPTTR